MTELGPHNIFLSMRVALGQGDGQKSGHDKSNENVWASLFVGSRPSNDGKVSSRGVTPTLINTFTTEAIKPGSSGEDDLNSM